MRWLIPFLLLGACDHNSPTPNCPGDKCSCGTGNCSCQSGASCVWLGDGCSPTVQSCGINCDSANTCTVVCQSFCDNTCRGGSTCSFNAPKGGRIVCDQSTCNVTIGKDSDVNCDSGATCHVTCTGTGGCAVTCSNGSTCDLKCPGDAAPHSVNSGGQC
jgi:hypothetical protein